MLDDLNSLWVENDPNNPCRTATEDELECIDLLCWLKKNESQYLDAKKVFCLPTVEEADSMLVEIAD